MNSTGRRLSGFLALVCLAGTAPASEVPLVPSGGVYTVPVRLNDALTLLFVVDSGASEVQIPAEAARTLLSQGALKERDFVQDRVYTMADGSRVKSERVLLRRVQIGDRVVEGVTASIGNVESKPLIGQSLLYRFPSWSLDNERHVLILGGAAPARAAAPPPKAAEAAAPVEARNPNPIRPPNAGGRDTRDKKLLRLLCGKTSAARMLDCAETP